MLDKEIKAKASKTKNSTKSKKRKNSNRKNSSLKSKKVKDDASIEKLTRSMRSCSVIEETSDIDSENTESLPKQNEKNPKLLMW